MTTTRVTFHIGGDKPPEAHLITMYGRGDFVSVYLTPEVHAFAQTRADCDAAIKAFIAARDLLPPDPAPPATDPGPDIFAPLPEKACGADWGSATASQRCVLPEGHGSNHIDPAGHAWGAPCGPGQCTCGGNVTADGVFHPVAVTA